MPDPTFQTISGSQVPDLLNVSPWGTRLTLHHQFVQQVHEDREQTIRMKIGKLFEGMILDLTAEKMVLEVRKNPQAVYLRHPTLPLGCTADAYIFCPTRGFGIVEAKAIDEYEFKRSWTEANGPVYYEAQLQEEMMIPHPEFGLPTWGALVPFIYTEERLVIYERRPNLKSQERIAAEAQAFMADVAANREPPAFGLPVELDLCNELWPEADARKVLDEPENFDMAELARSYAWALQQRQSFERAEKELKPKLVHFLKDHGAANLAGGVRLRLNKPTMAGSVVMLPAELRKGLRRVANYLEKSIPLVPEKNPLLEIVREAVEWAQVTKKPSTQSRLSVYEDGDPNAPPPDKSSVLEAG